LLFGAGAEVEGAELGSRKTPHTYPNVTVPERKPRTERVQENSMPKPAVPLCL
jgi:hypothetical protein